MAKKILKRVGWSFGGVILIVILLFFFWLGPLAKIMIENAGSDFLGTPVKIKSLSIHPLKGTLDLHLFTLQTHDGFKQKHTFTLDSLQLSIDPSSLFSDTIVIHKIQLNSPHFYYEQGEHANNISAILKHIKKNSKPSKPKPKSESTSKKIVVEQLLMGQLFIDVTNTEHPEHNIQLAAKELSFSTKTGKLHLGNISITNPKKIESPHLLTLNSADVNIDPATLFSDTIQIQNITLSTPKIFFEKNKTSNTATEYTALLRALLPPPTTTSPTPASSDGSPAPVQLNALNIQNLQLYAVYPPNPKRNIHAGFKTLQFSFPTGQLKIDQLAIANPKSIQTPNLFELKSAQLQLPKNLLTSTKPFAIQNAHLSQPYLFLEHNFDANSIPEWQAILQAFTQKTAPTTATKPNPKPASTSLLLQNIQIDDIQLKTINTAIINPPTHPKTAAKIGQLHGKISQGQLTIQHLAIANASGFLQTNFFELAEIQATFNPATLHHAPFTITEIALHNPTINLEQTKTQGNIIEWKKSIRQFFPKTQPSPSQKETEKTVPISSNPTFCLEKLTLTNLLVNMTSPLVEPKMLAKFAGKINPMNLLRTEPLPPVSSSKTMTLLSVQKSSIEPPKGLVQINELNLANPPGFSRTHMLAFEEIRIDFSPKSFRTQTIQIEDVLINKPRVSFERQFSVDNFQIFPEFLMAAINEPKPSFPHRALLTPPPPETPHDGKKVIITHVLIQGGNIHTKISKLPSLPIPLPQIVLTDIGKNEGGTSIQNALTRLYSSFYDRIMNSVSRVTGIAKNTLKGVTAFGKGTVGEITGGISGTLKKILPFKKSDPAESPKK